MYALPRTNHLRRGLLVNKDREALMKKAKPTPTKHATRVKDELRRLGMSRYGLWKLEARYLPHIIHADEHLRGIVYGHHIEGSALLVATDRRIIYLDRKPLFMNQDEVTYDVVSGVSYSFAGAEATVTLHTRVKDYTLRTYNKKTAEGFIEFIERHCLESQEISRLDTPVSW